MIGHDAPGHLVGAVVLAVCAAVGVAALPVLATSLSGAASPSVSASPSIGAGPTAVASPSAFASPGVAALDQPFHLAEGESAVVDEALHVTFASVVEDSRCPSDVQCVWEGNGEVAVEVSVVGQEPASLSLNTNPSFPVEASYLDYTLTLVELAPYPRQEPPPEGSYIATLIVSVDGPGATPGSE